MRALPHVLIYLTPALISATLVGLAWRKRYIRGGRPFTLLMSATCWWNTCHAISVADPTYEGTLFWSLLQYVGIVLVSPSWLLLALAYSGQWWRTYRWFRLGLFAPSLLALTVALTNDVHQLWWPTVDPDMSRGYMWLSVTRGPAFWAHAAYSYVCAMAGAILLARAGWHGTPAHRYHARLMLIGALMPLAGNFTFVTGIRLPWNDDPTPLFVLASGAMAYYATMRYRLVDLAPLAEREILAGLPDGLIVLDSRGRVADANNLAPGLLGLPPGRWAGRSLAQLSAASPLADDLRALLAAAPAAQTRQAIYEGAGGQRALELRLRPLIAGNGAAAGSLLLLRDITERVRVEQSQAQHLQELSLINRVARAANTATDTGRLIGTIAEAIATDSAWARVAVGLLDPDGVRMRIVVDRSPGGGPSYEGALAENPDAAELLAMLHAGAARQVALDEEGAARSEVAARLRAEGLCTLLTVPLYHQDKPLGLLLLGSYEPTQAGLARLRLAETIGELITDAVVRIRLYEEVSRADRLKASFLASVSHELRTPLTAIIGYTDMLQKGIYGPTTPAMAEPLSHMRHSSLSLLRLINDILDFSRMEAGHLQIDLHPVDLRQAITNVVGQIRPQVAERGLELRQVLDDDLPLALANPQRIEQVLANLLTNAVKFTESGSIGIVASRHADGIRLSVSDTGIGIAPEHQAAIFEEFRRVETPGGRRYGGAGLGLAICRRLMQLMGGAISVESAPGAGTTFHCDLPLAPEMEPIGATSAARVR